jgi:hypothetical protein
VDGKGRLAAKIDKSDKTRQEITVKEKIKKTP